MLILTIDKTVNLIEGTIMADTVSNKDLFFHVPTTQDDSRWKEIIKEITI